MMTYEEFYDEKLLPVYARLKEHAQRKSDGYAKLKNDFRKGTEELHRRKQELRANCSQENQLLDKMLCDIKGDLSPEADAKRLELRNRQTQNKQETLNAIVAIDMQLHQLSEDYRNAKVQLCIVTNAEEAALYGLIHARKEDYRHMRHQLLYEKFSPLKRWIYRRFFARKGGAV